MRSSHFRLAAAAAAILASPASAQVGAAVDFYSTRNAQLTPATAYGIGVAVGGAVAVRMSGALATRDLFAVGIDRRPGLQAYLADVDLVLTPGGLGHTSVYGFAGAGMAGRHTSATAPWDWGPTVSFGGGTTLQILGPLAVDGAARYRIPVIDSTRWNGAFPHGWEMRAGLALRFGGIGGRSASRDDDRRYPRTPRSGRFPRPRRR